MITSTPKPNDALKYLEEFDSTIQKSSSPIIQPIPVLRDITNLPSLGTNLGRKRVGSPLRNEFKRVREPDDTISENGSRTGTSANGAGTSANGVGISTNEPSARGGTGNTDRPMDETTVPNILSFSSQTNHPMTNLYLVEFQKWAKAGISINQRITKLTHKIILARYTMLIQFSHLNYLTNLYGEKLDILNQHILEKFQELRQKSQVLIQSFI